MLKLEGIKDGSRSSLEAVPPFLEVHTQERRESTEHIYGTKMTHFIKFKKSMEGL